MSKTALCIGINNYPGTGMDLQGCVNDANDWAEVLQARGYAVSMLLDTQATKAAMVQALTSVIGGAASGDSLVITFSGHGTYQPDSDGDEVDGLDEALCPYDLQTGGAALIDDEIRVLFAARKAGVRLLLISDSCHSGTVTRAAPSEPEAEAPRPRFMPMGNWLPQDQVAAHAQRQPGGKPCCHAETSVRVLQCAAQTAGRFTALRLQGRPQQFQLRRQNQRPLQRRVHLLRAQNAEKSARHR